MQSLDGIGNRQINKSCTIEQNTKSTNNSKNVPWLTRTRSVGWPLPNTTTTHMILPFHWTMRMKCRSLSMFMIPVYTHMHVHLRITYAYRISKTIETYSLSYIYTDSLISFIYLLSGLSLILLDSHWMSLLSFRLDLISAAIYVWECGFSFSPWTFYFRKNL